MPVCTLAVGDSLNSFFRIDVSVPFPSSPFTLLERLRSVFVRLTVQSCLELSPAPRSLRPALAQCIVSRN